MQTTPDPTADFRAVLEVAGLMPGEVAPDGALRRCPTMDHPQSANGWYVLHIDPPAGAYGDWSTGLKETWSMNGESLPPAKMARIRAEIEKQRTERERLAEETHRAKAAEAKRYLANLAPAGKNNPYLARKKVRPCAGLLVDGGALIVPVLNPDDNRPMSYQRIDLGGGKKFMAGGRMKGGFFQIRGDDGPLCIVEGIATGLSVHEATGATVLCGFSAGNLEAVAKLARNRYRERRIIVCADDDTKEDAP
ncbi:MAG: toprim domain-containing protein [Desulfobacterales bacterium]|nr:toprim domain-containing protein [Desulfobacterales bacterium]